MTQDQKPFITLVMPIYNEEDFISRSLGAVLAQDYPADKMQILVVDGMSKDNTRAIVQQMIKDNPQYDMKLLDNTGRIVPTGLNAALEHLKGDYLVRVDGHCEIAPDYVSKCIHYLQTEDIGGVGGPIETISDTPEAAAIAVAMSTPFGVGGSAFRTVKDRKMYADTIAFPAYTRVALEDAGPFDEQLVRNQDDEYNYRLRKLGYKLLLTPDIQSRYYSRANLRKLWRQYYQYGFYKVRVMQKHPQQMSLRQFVPPAFVSFLIGGAVLSVFSRWLLILWLLGIVAYAVLNLGISWRVSAKENIQQKWMLPAAFLILHISYGLGFWRGLWHFYVQKPS